MKKAINITLLIIVQFIVLFEGLAQINTVAQFKSTFQFGDNQSFIEIASNGDTVLVSQISLKNTLNSSIDIVEKVFKGTPLLGNAWFSNGIIYDTGYPKKGIIAYNLDSKTLLFAFNDISKAMEVKPDSFIINNTKFLKLVKPIKGAYGNYFQKVYAAPKGEIFKEHHVNYRPTNLNQKTGYDAPSKYEGSYIKSSAIYLAINGNWIEIKPNKSVFNLFGEKEDVVEKYAKEMKLNVKKETDLIEILKFYLNKN